MLIMHTFLQKLDEACKCDVTHRYFRLLCTLTIYSTGSSSIISDYDARNTSECGIRPSFDIKIGAICLSSLHQALVRVVRVHVGIDRVKHDVEYLGSHPGSL